MTALENNGSQAGTADSCSEASPGTARAHIAPSHFAHFVIYSSQFRKVTAWYKLVLCPATTFEDEEIAFLTFDEEHHRVAILSVPNLARQTDGVASIHHVAFTYRTLRDLLLTWKRLVVAGIQPDWCVNHGPTTSIYYSDPDGNRIEFQVDNFATSVEAIAYCAGPAFRENSVGVDFDPAELLRRIEAGEPEAVLKIRPNIGPRTERFAPKRS
jgi:catechol 2,3-dioxygenase-like lactoylglutathione lyase family enzyme